VKKTKEDVSSSKRKASSRQSSPVRSRPPSPTVISAEIPEQNPSPDGTTANPVADTGMVGSAAPNNEDLRAENEASAISEVATEAAPASARKEGGPAEMVMGGPARRDPAAPEPSETTPPKRGEPQVMPPPKTASGATVEAATVVAGKEQVKRAPR
jgi:hypothetical protein